MSKSIIAIVMLAACGTYQPFHPATVRAPEDAFNKSVRVLVTRGESIETKDEDAGIIVTAWKERSSEVGDPQRFRWTVTVANAAVTVASQCETKIDGGPLSATKWENCGERQPAERSELAKAIADEIGQ